MATRYKRVFITPEEFVQWLPEEAQALGASLIVERRDTIQLMHWDGTREALLGAFRIYFAQEKPNLEGVTVRGLAPGRLGWCDIDVPRIEGNSLLLISLGVKSSWDDWDNPSVIKFFDKFWRQWKKHFRYGVTVKNIKYGDEGLSRDVGYSPGVVGWCAKGGELRQWGVDNIAFFLPPSAESSE